MSVGTESITPTAGLHRPPLCPGRPHRAEEDDAQLSAGCKAFALCVCSFVTHVPRPRAVSRGRVGLAPQAARGEREAPGPASAPVQSVHGRRRQERSRHSAQSDRRPAPRGKPEGREASEPSPSLDGVGEF